MILANYGIQLKQIEKADIEVIRRWRNDPKISQFMNFRRYITAEMQERWYQSISNKYNYFFIIEFEGRKLGLIDLKGIDYEERRAEAGIFIYEDEFIHDVPPFKATLILYDFAFDTLNLRYITAHILKSNRRAIRFNKFLGFVLQPGQDEIEHQLYILEKSEYERTRKRLERTIANS